MQFPTLLTLALPLVASASQYIPEAIRPNGATIVSDLLSVDKSVQSLTKRVLSYEGGSLVSSILEGAPVLYDAAAIQVTNRKAWVDAKAAEPFTVEEATLIVDTVGKTLAIHIPEAIDAMIAKKDEFVKAKLGRVVSATMESLKSNHETLSGAILEKAQSLGAVQASQGAKSVKTIMDKLNEGIAVFKNEAKGKDEL